MSVVYLRFVLKTSDMLHILSPSIASKSLFCVHLSGDPVVFSSGFAGVSVTLSATVEVASTVWFRINSRLCAFRLKSSIKVRSLCKKQCLFVTSSYLSLTDGSPVAVKDESYH